MLTLTTDDSEPITFTMGIETMVAGVDAAAALFNAHRARALRDVPLFAAPARVRPP